jgi:PAS domain-containing protein
LADAVVHAARAPLVILDDALRIVSANEPFARMMGVASGQAAGRRLYEMAGGMLDVHRFHDIFEQDPGHSGPLGSMTMQAHTPGRGTRTLAMSFRRLVQRGQPERLVVSFEDVTGAPGDG